MKPIYEPKTRAKEYCDLAINIFRGCGHNCSYCYSRKMFERYHPGEDFSRVTLRPGIIEATEKQLSSGKFKGKKIMLCFMTDPYTCGIDTTPTREIIKLIKAAGAHVQILTKGGARAKRDFDLLDSEDSFGVTVSCFDSAKVEPFAAPTIERLETLRYAHENGLKTWLSCEPVFDTLTIYQLIANFDYIDMYRIGKLNYMQSNINWLEFGRQCEWLCKRNNRNYYIKEDLRKCMEGLN